MAETDVFRRQHGELARLSAQIAGRLSVEAVLADTRGLRILVARFAGLLRMHERMESEALYPSLRSHEDPSVRDTAERLFAALGPLYTQFDGYEKRWPSAEAIAEAPSAFIEDTHALFTTLGHRMSVENRELYPLVEAYEARPIERTRPR